MLHYDLPAAWDSSSRFREVAHPTVTVEVVVQPCRMLDQNAFLEVVLYLCLAQSLVGFGASP